jgi:hypothetical protein
MWVKRLRISRSYKFGWTLIEIHLRGQAVGLLLGIKPLTKVLNILRSQAVGLLLGIKPLTKVLSILRSQAVGLLLGIKPLSKVWCILRSQAVGLLLGIKPLSKVLCILVEMTRRRILEDSLTAKSDWKVLSFLEWDLGVELGLRIIIFPWVFYTLFLFFPSFLSAHLANLISIILDLFILQWFWYDRPDLALLIWTQSRVKNDVYVVIIVVLLDKLLTQHENVRNLGISAL